MNINERTLLDSELLRTFLTITETQNLTQAANHLNRTQSAISVQIRKLEEALGTRLFARQPRGMKLTEDGHRLLPEARRLVRDVDRVSRLFSDSLTGQIRIGIPDDFPRLWLEEILQTFAARHPDVDVTVNCSFSECFPQSVHKGELDLALYTVGPGGIQDAIICQAPMVWAVTESFVADPEKPLPVALFNRECWWRDCAIAALDTAGINYRIAFSSESLSGIYAAIHAGLAVGVLSRPALQPGMRELSVNEALPTLPLTTTVLLTGEQQSPLITAMTEVIEAVSRA